MNKVILAFCLLCISGVATAANLCNGKFMNPITDVCWDCAFPIKMFGQKITSGDGEDYDSRPATGIDKWICACNIIGGLSKTGVPVSFWEFSRQVDVTKTPYCLVGLGQKMSVSINADMDAGKIRVSGEDSRAVFRHLHWYINPLMGLMGAVLDSKCLENKGYDLAYITELDKTWIDEELARIMTPDAYLFNNLVAQLACGVDCIAASTGMDAISNTLFWCSGCNGALYPLDGWTSAAYSGAQVSSLLTHRMVVKQHRQMSQTSSAGPDAMCSAGHIEVTMDKRQYKYTMVFPVPQATPKANGISADMLVPSSKTQYWDLSGGAAATSATIPPGDYSGTAGSSGFLLSCCQPFGRTTVMWGSGREIPFTGEDFSYAIFRKRDCCQM